jgi:G3E family GTPase
VTDVPDFTPVNLITGFLGSGKTSLLKRLLADPGLHNTAVLINEFGEVGLDHLLLERIDDEMVLLQSGCVCCTIRGELSDAIRQLHGKRERGEMPAFRRLVVESSGLADPFPILSTVHADPVIRHHFRLGAVVTTIDAVNGASQLERQAESVKQLAVADRVVLTKTDIAGNAAIDAVTARIDRLNPAAPVFRAAEDRISADLLIGDAFAMGKPGSHAADWFSQALAALGKGRKLGHWHGTEAGKGIESAAITFEGALDWPLFGIWLTFLLHAHGERILRVKGLLNVEGTDRPVALHGVQHIIHPPSHLADWPDADRRSKLVFITQGLESSLIERSMRAFGVFGEGPASRQ